MDQTPAITHFALFSVSGISEDMKSTQNVEIDML